MGCWVCVCVLFVDTSSPLAQAGLELLILQAPVPTVLGLQHHYHTQLGLVSYLDPYLSPSLSTSVFSQPVALSVSLFLSL